MDTENEAPREYGGRHAPIVVAAFVEAHEELFAAWLKANDIDPRYGVDQWRSIMAMWHREIVGVTNLALQVTLDERDLPRSRRAPK